MVLTGVVRRLPARKAVAMGADVLVLDDGFQHLAVARDLDLVLFSADHLAGNSRIFPGGDLREPVAALARASAFVLTGIEPDNQERAKRFAGLLTTRFPATPVFYTRTRVSGFVLRSGESCVSAGSDYHQLAREKVFALCGIARPDSFRQTLAQCKITPEAFLALPDHHRYKEADLARIRREVNKSGARTILTTEKDLVKLGQADLGVPVVGVRLDVEMDKPLREKLGTALTVASQGLG
jgi:tetraacyldisaccharide 4'-kinase